MGKHPVRSALEIGGAAMAIAAVLGVLIAVVFSVSAGDDPRGVRTDERVVLLEPADLSGPGSIANVAIGDTFDPDLLPSPATDSITLLTPSQPGSTVDLALRTSLRPVLGGTEARGPSVAGIEAAVASLGAGFELEGLVDVDEDDQDDDGAFSLLGADGSGACVSIGPRRALVDWFGLPYDPVDGAAADGATWSATGPCGAPVPTPPVATASGDLPGRFGGLPDRDVCTLDTLIRVVVDSPPASVAWATALGVERVALRTTMEELTPVILLEDARVTDIRVYDGHPVAVQAVMQRGTPILVDRFGVPRGRCPSGTPLMAPQPLSEAVVYQGAGWPGATTVVFEVTPGDEPVAEFVVLDVGSAEPFSLPVGGLRVALGN